MQSVKVHGTAPRLMSLVFYPIKKTNLRAHRFLSKAPWPEQCTETRMWNSSRRLWKKKKGLMGCHSRNSKHVHTFILLFGRDFHGNRSAEGTLSQGHFVPLNSHHFFVHLEVSTRRCLHSTTARMTRDSAPTFKSGLQTYGTRAQDDRWKDFFGTRHSLLS